MRKLLVVPAIVAIAALTACAGPYHRQYASDLEYDGLIGAVLGFTL